MDEKNYSYRGESHDAKGRVSFYASAAGLLTAEKGRKELHRRRGLNCVTWPSEEKVLRTQPAQVNFPTSKLPPKKVFLERRGDSQGLRRMIIAGTPASFALFKEKETAANVWKEEKPCAGQGPVRKSGWCSHGFTAGGLARDERLGRGGVEPGTGRLLLFKTRSFTERPPSGCSPEALSGKCPTLTKGA